MEEKANTPENEQTASQEPKRLVDMDYDERLETISSIFERHEGAINCLKATIDELRDVIILAESIGMPNSKSLRRQLAKHAYALTNLSITGPDKDNSN